jgi:hypothetical protein
VIVPLLVIMDKKPVKWLPREQSLDELWPVPRDRTSVRLPRVPDPFSWRDLLWKNLFIAVEASSLPSRIRSWPCASSGIPTTIR